MKTLEIDGRPFFWTRPYRFSRLEFAIRQPANESAPEILGLPGDNRTIQDGDGCEWFSSAALFDGVFLPKKISQDPSWFFRTLARRHEVFADVKQTIARLIRECETIHKDDSAALLSAFTDCTAAYRAFLPYVYLCQMADRPLVDALRTELVDLVGVDIGDRYLADILVSDYVAGAIEAGDTPLRLSKTLTFPPPELATIPGGQIRSVTSELDGVVFQECLRRAPDSVEAFSRFLHLRLVVPFVYQIGQENPHVGLPIVGVLGWVTWALGLLLTDSGTLPAPHAIADLRPEDIAEMVGGCG